MDKSPQKAWKTFKNRVKNSVCVVARAVASAGYGIGYEELSVHRLWPCPKISLT